MPFTKKKRKARELMNADVSHISLVARGANGQPFTVLKTGEAQVAHFWVSKKANQQAVERILKSQNYDIDSPESGDFNWIYWQQNQNELDLDEIIVFKLGKGVAAGLLLGGDSLDEEDIGESKFTSEVFKKDYAILVNDANDVLSEVTRVAKTDDYVVDSYRSHANYVSKVTDLVPDSIVQLSAILKSWEGRNQNGATKR